MADRSAVSPLSMSSSLSLSWSASSTACCPRWAVISWRFSPATRHSTGQHDAVCHSMSSGNTHSYRCMVHTMRPACGEPPSHLQLPVVQPSSRTARPGRLMQHNVVPLCWLAKPVVGTDSRRTPRTAVAPAAMSAANMAGGTQAWPPSIMMKGSMRHVRSVSPSATSNEQQHPALQRVLNAVDP